MSYQHGMSNDAPPTFAPHQLHHIDTTRMQTEGRIHLSDQLSPPSTCNVPSSRPSLGMATTIPHRKQRSTKPRRSEIPKKRNTNGGANIKMTKELTSLLHWCRSNDWHRVLQALKANPCMALEPLKMDNSIPTTTLHQAISSKGDTSIRTEVVMAILTATPEAAKLTNGYGSMPIHALAQRNVKMDSQTKERLMIELVHCYKDSLTSNGGLGGRTPLHIIFTDYVSPTLTKFIIESSPEACFMKDNKLCLPAHIACSRHCSPEKLRMLLAVNPAALHARDEDDKTPLDLAVSKATEAHPNYALIEELQKQLAGDVSHYDPIIFNTPVSPPSTSRSRPHYGNENRNIIEGTPAVVSIVSHLNDQHQYSGEYPSYTHTPSPTSREYHYHLPHAQQPFQRHYHPSPHSTGPYHMQLWQNENHGHTSVGRVSSEDDEADRYRSHLDANETWTSPTRHHIPQQSYYPHPYTHHQDDRHVHGLMALDHRYSDGGSYPTFGKASQRYTTPDYTYVYTPPELSFTTHPQSGRKTYGASPPSRQRQVNSSAATASIKSEEPAAKLLLHFSRNLNASSDDDTSHNHDADGVVGYHIDDIQQDEGYNRFGREYSAHHGSRQNDARETTDSSLPPLDIPNSCCITEV